MKALWRRLSVFPADFNETAIAFVLDISADDADKAQKQLRRFSLLEVNPRNRRFNFHDLIQVFTDAKLLTEERFKTQFLHSKYYASIPQKIHEIKLGDDKNSYINALNLLDVEWNNIIVGQKWAANLVEQNKSNSMPDMKPILVNSGKSIEPKEVYSRLCLAYSGNGRELLKLRLHPLENVEWLKSSSTAARILNDQICIANNSRSLGIAYKDIGENEKSLSYFNQALVIYRKNEDWESICGVLGSLANLYISSGKYLNAEECCREALKLSQNILNKLDFIMVELQILNTLGNICLGKRREDEAVAYFKYVLSNCRGSLSLKNSALGGLGIAYLDLKNYSKSARYTKRALRIARKTGDSRSNGRYLGNLGTACMGLGNMENACNLWKEAMTILQEMKSPEAKFYKEQLLKYCRD